MHTSLTNLFLAEVFCDELWEDVIYYVNASWKSAEKSEYHNRGEKWINQSLPFDHSKSIEAILVDQ